MVVFIFWIIFSFVVATIGSSRQVGFGLALLASLFLSPLIGLIIVLVSQSKDEEQYKKELINSINKSKNGVDSTAIQEELIRLEALRDNNYISDQEYQKLRAKLFE